MLIKDIFPLLSTSSDETILICGLSYRVGVNETDVVDIIPAIGGIFSSLI